MDFVALHKITGDITNLSIHSEYDGTNEVILGDGSDLCLSHIGSFTLKSPKKNFVSRYTLCVPKLRRNLIYMHHFTKQNNVFVEYHPFYFSIKLPNPP